MLIARLFCCALVAAMLIRPTPSLGCAAAPPKGMTVEIAEESAVIIWDAASKTQHFIRRASFVTSAPDFGFLVPTPSRPKLGDVSDEVFDRLADWIKPRLVEKSEGIRLVSFCCIGLSGLSERGVVKFAPPGASVRVLEARRVGGYDVRVLEADNASALGDWLKEHGYPSTPELLIPRSHRPYHTQGLKEHGYPSTPELTSWMGPYIAEKWKITAFKVAGDKKADSAIRTGAVRMSFQTERPFFPYREPESNEKPNRNGRLLRVFFVGPKRAAGTLGNAPWHATVPWADRLVEEQGGSLGCLVCRPITFPREPG